MHDGHAIPYPHGTYDGPVRAMCEAEGVILSYQTLGHHRSHCRDVRPPFLCFILTSSCRSEHTLCCSVRFQPTEESGPLPGADVGGCDHLGRSESGQIEMAGSS